MIFREGHICIVTDIDAANRKVRAMWPTGEANTGDEPIDGVPTNWLFVLSWFGVYNMPEVNDQVAVLFDEEFNQGIVIGIVTKDGDAPYSDEDIIGIKLANVEIKITKSTGAITVISSDEINVQGSTVNIEADEVNITGDLSVSGKTDLTGDVTAGAKINATGAIKSTVDVTAGPLNLSLLAHKHPTAATGPPSPPIP